VSTDTIDDQAGEQEGDETLVSWLPDADEETADYLRSRGWDKDPRGALKAQREGEGALRKEQSARADMERELADARENLAALSEQQGGQQLSQDEDPFGLAQAAEAYENGQISMAQLVQFQNAAVLHQARAIAEEAVGQRVDPLANRQHTADLQKTASEIAANYDDFRELSDDVLALMQKNPSKYGDSEGMWAAYGLVKARSQQAEVAQRRASAGTETLDQGSRGQQYEDAQDALRKQLREMSAPTGGL